MSEHGGGRGLYAILQTASRGLTRHFDFTRRGSVLSSIFTYSQQLFQLISIYYILLGVTAAK